MRPNIFMFTKNMWIDVSKSYCYPQSVLCLRTICLSVISRNIAVVFLTAQNTVNNLVTSPPILKDFRMKRKVIWTLVFYFFLQSFLKECSSPPSLQVSPKFSHNIRSQTLDGGKENIEQEEDQERIFAVETTRNRSSDTRWIYAILSWKLLFNQTFI